MSGLGDSRKASMLAVPAEPHRCPNWVHAGSCRTSTKSGGTGPLRRQPNQRKASVGQTSASSRSSSKQSSQASDDTSVGPALLRWLYESSPEIPINEATVARSNRDLGQVSQTSASKTSSKPLEQVPEDISHERRSGSDKHKVTLNCQ